MHVYHFKDSDMKGNTLYPLNLLRDIRPEVYERAIQKYHGREYLLQKQLPFLDCLWNDVIHLSPINPQLVLDEVRRNNLPSFTSDGEVLEVFRIPAAVLPEKETLCFQSFNFDFDNFSSEREKFWSFSAGTYQELTTVPEQQVEVWKKDHAAGRQLFWYSHTQHVLSRTRIDVSACEVIYCR